MHEKTAGDAVAVYSRKCLPALFCIFYYSPDEQGIDKYYYCAAFCQEEVIAKEISFRSGYFESEFQELYELLEGGEMKETYEEFISPVFVMEAIKKSYETGEIVEVL